MAEAQPLDHSPAAGTAAQTITAECDAKLERYRAALDAGANPAVVTSWIAQTQAERARAEADLRANTGTAPRRYGRTDRPGGQGGGEAAGTGAQRPRPRPGCGAADEQ